MRGKALCPRLGLVESTDCATIPKSKGPLIRSLNLAPVSNDQELIFRKSCTAHNVHFTQTVTPKSKFLTWVPFLTLQTSLVQVIPYQKLYETRQCAAWHGILYIEPRQEIHVMNAVFKNYPITLTTRLLVAIARAQPLVFVISNIAHAQIFPIETNEKETYKKQNFNVYNTALINQYLAESRYSQMNWKKKPATADDIDLTNIKSRHHTRIFDMLKC